MFPRCWSRYVVQETPTRAAGEAKEAAPTRSQAPGFLNASANIIARPLPSRRPRLLDDGYAAETSGAECSDSSVMPMMKAATSARSSVFGELGSGDFGAWQPPSPRWAAFRPSEAAGQALRRR